MTYRAIIHVLDRIARLSDAAFAAPLILISLIAARGDVTIALIPFYFFVG